MLKVPFVKTLLEDVAEFCVGTCLLSGNGMLKVEFDKRDFVAVDGFDGLLEEGL